MNPKITHESSAVQDSSSLPPDEIRVEDPGALYEEPPSQTSYGRFRSFALGSKRIIYAIVLVAMVGGIAASMRSVTGFEGRLESYFQRFTGKLPPSGYQIAASEIDESELRSNFEIHKRLLGPLEYTTFVREQFETDLVLRAALDEGLLSSPEAAMVLETALRRAAAEYYIRKKFSGELAAQPISTGEAKLVYEKTKSTMKELKLSEPDAIESIRNTLIAVQAQEIRAKQALVRRELTKRLKQVYTTRAPEAAR